MDFNKATLNVIREKMQEALNDVSIEGLTIVVGNCSYGDDDATFKVNITTTDERPLFLCEWDGGSLTEVHTRESLKSQYGDTNLYEPYEGGKHLWIRWKDNASVYPSIPTFEEVLDEMCSTFFADRSVDYTCENMKIVRIR